MKNVDMLPPEALCRGLDHLREKQECSVQDILEQTPGIIKFIPQNDNTKPAVCWHPPSVPFSLFYKL